MRYTEAFVALASSQLEVMVAFYEGLLAQQATPFWPGRYAEWALKGGLKLGIFGPKADHQAEFAAEAAGPFSLCLEVENLEAAIAHLTRLGYPPPGPVQTASHGREVYAYDPDGNRIILHQGHLEPG
jgi:hypothetical protein